MRQTSDTEQCEKYRDALIEIRDFKFILYENTSPDQYWIGVTDGHRCCSMVARKALGGQQDNDSPSDVAEVAQRDGGEQAKHAELNERICNVNVKAQEIEAMLKSAVNVCGNGSLSADWITSVILPEMRLMRTWLDDEVAEEFS